MSTARRNIEDVIVALLKTQSPLDTGTKVLHHDEDTDTHTNKDRVVVSAGEPVPLVPGITPRTPPEIHQTPVDITIRCTTKEQTLIDTWEAAVNTALDTSPTAVQTLAASYFSAGFEIDAASNGFRQGDSAEQRERTKTINVVTQS